MIAMRRNEPHWLLSEQDAKTYGAAIGNAMRHLPMNASQKALDFSALLFCAMHMETPRIYASVRNAHNARNRRNAHPDAGLNSQAVGGRDVPGGATVYPFPNSPPQPGAAAPSPPQGGGVEGFTGEGVDSPPMGPA